MDQIDINLFNAWNRIGEQCRVDRVEALKRCRRQFRKALHRPPRAWCLVIRAADTRITSDNAFFEEECAKYHQAHDLLLTGELIAKLTKPVYIPWPGVPTWEAAKRLGVSHHFAWLAARKGHLATWGYDYCGMHSRACKPIPIVYTPTEVDPNQFKLQTPDAMWGELWKWAYEKIPAEYRQWARRVPRLLLRKGQVVFRGWDWVCPGRLTRLGRADVAPPDIDSAKTQACPRMAAAVAEVNRESIDCEVMDDGDAGAEERDRVIGLSLIDAGMETREYDETYYMCRADGPRAKVTLPAREVEIDGERYLHKPCGRRCKYLYGPLPIWTLAKATGMDWSLEMPEDSGLSGTWSPGWSGSSGAGANNAAVGEGERTFACKECWDVWNSTLSNHTGWNDFVSYVSGGLLYGREVERPLKEVPIARKRRTWKRKSKPRPPGDERTRHIEGESDIAAA